MKQAGLFDDEFKVSDFKHRSRGQIYCNKIWPELSIHQKINLRVIYGEWNDETWCCFSPNYMVITSAIREGLDKSPFASSEDAMCSYLQVSSRKFKNT